METIISQLQAIGLTNIQAQCYVAIINHGESSAPKIAKVLGQHKPNVYHAIGVLVNKGLVASKTGSRGAVYIAMHPRALLQETIAKGQIAAKVSSQLATLFDTGTTNSTLRIIEGEAGWKHLLNEFLETKKSRYVYGIPAGVIRLEPFFDDYHNERAMRKLKLFHIFNYDARERINKTKKLPFTQSKYLPKLYDQPVSVSVCGDLVAFTLYEPQTILTYVITDGSLARAHLKHFKRLWKLARLS